MNLILASGSASRRAMLTAAGVPFTARSPGVDEEAAKAALAGHRARDLADALAKLKAVKVSSVVPGALVLGSDSIVELADGTLLDKPTSREEAAEHLMRMSGTHHDLHSAAVVAEDGRAVWRSVDRARLHVRPLSYAFVEAYLDAEWPAIAGCVGCYRVEGPGVQLFTRIEGSQFTVLGMPLLPVLDYLRTRAILPGLSVRMPQLPQHSRPYAEVIGDPIAQSKSPLIHRFWLDALGIDADYRATQVTEAGLADHLARCRADPAWRGCNITKPLKIAALDHVEDRGQVRGSIGAINTAFRAEDGAVVGTNTDAAGFYAPIADLDLSGRAVTVVGSGGAARGVLFALARLGVGAVTLLVRSPLKGAALLSGFGLKGQALPLAAGTPAAALLVNASTLGMVGEPPLTLDLSPLPDEAVVYDLVYAPLDTGLLTAARARDLDTVDGLEMLVGQAAVAFELFFGEAPPRDRDDELRELLLQ